MHHITYQAEITVWAFNKAFVTKEKARRQKKYQNWQYVSSAITFTVSKSPKQILTNMLATTTLLSLDFFN